MIRYRDALVAILIAGASFSSPAAAQHGEMSKSLTHVVSATIAPRVKTRVSPLSLSSGASAPAVNVTRTQATSSGLGLTVNATQAWVLSIKASASQRAAAPTLRWSSSPKGEFKALTSADTVLVAGQRSSSADTAIFFRDARPTDGDSTVFLTISAP